MFPSILSMWQEQITKILLYIAIHTHIFQIVRWSNWTSADIWVTIRDYPRHLPIMEQTWLLEFCFGFIQCKRSGSWRPWSHKK